MSDAEARRTERRFAKVIDALKLLFVAGLITEPERRRIEGRLVKRTRMLGYTVKVTR